MKSTSSGGAGAWTPALTNAPAVIALRLTLLPWMWWLDPAAAQRESHLMTDEKRDAWMQSQALLWQAPMRFWWDFSQAAMSTTPSTAFERTMRDASQRIAEPWNRRVTANRRRLTKLTGAGGR